MRKLAPLESQLQHDSLAAALTFYDIDLPAEQVKKLDEYRAALWAWNEKLNLTRHTDLDKFVTRDVVDSLELARMIDDGDDVLDVGTGGGVPGVILAIVRPDLEVSLCESVGKRAKAVSDIVKQLGLHIPVHHERLEKHLEEMRYGTLVARGVAPLWKFLLWLEPHWHAVWQVFLIKGTRWTDERTAARERGQLKGKINLRVAAEYDTPGSGAKNYILKLWSKEAD